MRQLAYSLDGEGDLYKSFEDFNSALDNKDEMAIGLYKAGEEDVIRKLAKEGYKDKQIGQIMDKNAKDIKLITNLRKFLSMNLN